MSKEDPPLTRAQFEAVSRFAQDLSEQARARARDRGLTPAEIEAEEIDDDSEFGVTYGPLGRLAWDMRSRHRDAHG